MHEDKYEHIISIPKKTYTVGDKTFTYYCERNDRTQAEAIRDDLKAQDIHAIITRSRNKYVVWRV